MQKMLICLTLLLPITVLAIPTGLNMMPTAETLGLAQTRLDYESEGSGKLFVPVGSDSTVVGSEFGMVLGLEGGIDQVSETGTVYNLKWVFKREGLVFPAIAVGAQNLSSGEASQYYAVATKSVLPTGMAKVHGGFLYDGDDTLTMIGASAKFGPITVKADKVTGGFHEGDAISAGWQTDSLAFTGTRYNMKNAPDETTFTFSYFYR